MKSAFKFGLAAAVVLAAFAAPAFAQVGETNGFGVPEIGMGGLASAATLLSGGYLMLKSKLGRRK